jgi:hypothetical protein
VNLTRLLSSGTAFILLLTMGCGSNGFYVPPHTVYIVQDVVATNGTAPARIFEFPAIGLDNSPPTAILTPPSNTDFVGQLAVDPAGNLYAVAVLVPSQTALPTTPEVLVYAPGATTPTRTLLLPPLPSPYSAATEQVAVDAMGEIYITTGGCSDATGVFQPISINVYAASATGSANPIRQISGSLTQLLLPNVQATNTCVEIPGIAVDSSQNIYAEIQTILPSSYPPVKSVLVFSATANGNVAPSRVIAGSATGLYGDGVNDTQLLVDSEGDIFTTTYIPSSQSNAIVEFAPGVSGNVAPINTINTSPIQILNLPTPSTGTTYTIQPNALALDAAGDLYSAESVAIMQTSPRNITYMPVIEVFLPNASGSAIPVQTITLTTAINAVLPSVWNEIAVR